MKILLLNGPNLDRLGERQPEIYGHDTLSDIEARLRAQASAAGHELEAFQSSSSEELISRLEATGADAVIINPASLTHHDRALAQALAAYPGIVIEVHISNIHRREPYRRRSLISATADGSIIGLGVRGYELALSAVIERRKDRS